MDFWREYASILESEYVLCIYFFCGCIFGYLFACIVDFFHLVKKLIENHLF